MAITFYGFRGSANFSLLKQNNYNNKHLNKYEINNPSKSVPTV